MDSPREGRKVLLSIKVSTLLTIILTIIISVMTVSLMQEKLAQDKVRAEEAELEKVAVEEGKIAVEIMDVQNDINEYFHETARSIDRKELEEILNPVQTTKIEDVTISRDMDLTVRTGLSREDFIKLMTDLKPDISGFFETNAGLIYDYCEQYQINEIFFVGLISAESGWNIAQNHRNTHNYISLMSSKGLIRYESVESGLETAAKVLHEKYLTPGGAFYYGPTLSGVKTRFCPASATWVDLVYGRMKQVIK